MSTETYIFEQAAISIKEISEQVQEVTINQARLADRVQTNYERTCDKLNTLTTDLLEIKKIVQIGFNSTKPLTQRADINKKNIEHLTTKFDKHLNDIKTIKQEKLKGRWQLRDSLIVGITALLVALITVFGPRLFSETSHLQIPQQTIEEVK